MASAERASAHNGQHGQKNECASDRKIMQPSPTHLPSALVTHAVAGAVVAAQYAGGFWSGFLAGFAEERARIEIAERKGRGAA